MGCHQPAPRPTYFVQVIHVYHPQPSVPSAPPPPPPPPVPALKECHIEAHIVDVHSFVTVSQKFHNSGTVPSASLRYNFSVLAGAAICGFELIRASGKKVIGVIKGKEQAEQELKAAIAAGHTHAYGEELTKDVFSISVGNIGPNETITVNISYINPFIDDDSNYRGRAGLKPQLRFTVPRAYMQRAGQAPNGELLKGATPTNIPFTMKLSIEQATPIIDHRTPGYSPEVAWGPVGASSDLSNEERERFVTLTFPSSTSSTDVVVVITADKIGDSRVFIERHPAHKTAALALTLVPANKAYESEIDMVYIAVVDQSKSMDGLKLDATKKALGFLLDHLPSKGTSFNLFSYGERVEGLWKEARDYNDIELERAKSYINRMTASFGANKQTSKALKHVFDSLASAPGPVRPVSIFLLTDGAAWDVKECIAATEAAVRARTTPQNFMRVFTVGLGDGVSTETCDGIARAGHGFATYVVTAEPSFLGKAVRLVLAARTPPITKFKIFWEKEKPNTASVRQSSTQPQQRMQIGTTSAEDGHEYVPPKDFGALVQARQAPADVTMLHGTRLSVFAIVPLSILTEKKALRVEFNLGDQEVQLGDIPIVDLPHSSGKTFLHTLAAKALITDIEDQHLTSSGIQAAELKEDITRYGLQYGLTSRFTSFLAVDDNRAVGIANDVFGVTSTIPRRLPASERSSSGSFTSFFAHPEAASISSRSASVPTKIEDLPPPDDPEVLFELSDMQSCDGGSVTVVFIFEHVISKGNSFEHCLNKN
ncbi:hypothetical protein GALMADRAFT_144419 [Galerina marginata CBS 339.88]|uniref:VWFA domain-containing protein n=1 Tax=Galerina marginata (strain CBS 339.88) TaxID=685588 RepID=A0A067SW44_GALM3|nr:hypothetical protein GALMADRAFT_144419 [Galerina marginata CBS 339.88]